MGSNKRKIKNGLMDCVRTVIYILYNTTTNALLKNKLRFHEIRLYVWPNYKIRYEGFFARIGFLPSEKKKAIVNNLTELG